MKIKKLILIVMISLILISIPGQIWAWGAVARSTYEVCNMINICIAGTLRIVAFAVGIIYISAIIKHKASSKEEMSKKISKSIIPIIIQIVVLLVAAILVTQVGLETRIYGEKYQVFDFSDIFRIIAFVSIVFCIIKAIIHYVSSEGENKQKIITIAKLEVITSIIVTILLIFAKNI